MPTGYTAAILEGATFDEFVWGCAKAMGAFIMQRDDENSAPPKFNDKPQDYYSTNLAKAKDELATMRARTDDEWATEHKSYIQATNERNKKSTAENAEQRAKYQEMLERVQQWEPPSEDHKNFKKFMVDQITESIRFDTGHGPYLTEPLGLVEWRAKEIEKTIDNIAYYTREDEKEVERTDSRNRWKNQLLASVPLPKKFQ